MADKTKFFHLSGTTKQILAGVAVAVIKSFAGMNIGWPTVLPRIQADNTTSLVVTDQDVTWLVSTAGLTGIAAVVFTSPGMELVGPSRYMWLLLIPGILSWLLLAFTPYTSLLYLARVVNSLVSNMFGPVPATIISENSEPHLRGFLLMMEEITVALGQLGMYITATFMPWPVATAACAVPSFLFFVCAYFVPESPYWLVRKGNMKAAADSIARLRDCKHDVDHEVAKIEAVVKQQPQHSLMQQVRSLRDHWRPVALLSGIFMLRELGGQHVVFSYTVYLFRASGVELDAFTCTLVVGALRLVSSTAAVFLVERLGRRPLMVATSAVCCLALLVAGLFLMLVPEVYWVPLAAVLLYVASFGLGIGPVPWALMGEMIPTPVRSLGGSIANLWFNGTLFAVSFCFPLIMANVGLAEAFLGFAAAHAALTALLWRYLPETRGKTLQDLDQAFTS